MSTGCGAASPVAPGESGAFTMQVGELDREYLVHLPPDYGQSSPTTMVIDFHGYTGVSKGEEAYTGLSRHADENGYIVVYPQGGGFTIETGGLIT